MPANSKASQLLNGFGNFMNGVSNAAREVVANPIADVAGLAAKGLAGIPNAISGGKVNKAIDTVVSAAKGEQPGSLQKQPNDPTSVAQAVGEGLTRGVDAAAAVVSLADLARQLPKAAQKGWKTILNKVNKANTPAKQQAVAKEARDYVTKHIEINDDLSKRMYNQSAEVPAYQQRAYASENPGMAKYKTNAAGTNFAVTKDGETTLGGSMFSYDNSLKQKLDSTTASQLGVPYGGKNMKNIRAVQKEVQDLVKMPDKEFKKLMQDEAAASTAGYGDWRYNLGEDWINNWNNPKEYQRMKEEIVDNILNDAGLNYGVAEAYGDAIKSNAAKSSKRYRNWIKKDMKNRYDEATYGTTRAQEHADRLAAANAEEASINAARGPEYDFYF